MSLDSGPHNGVGMVPTHAVIVLIRKFILTEMERRSLNFDLFTLRN